VRHPRRHPPPRPAKHPLPFGRDRRLGRETDERRETVNGCIASISGLSLARYRSGTPRATEARLDGALPMALRRAPRAACRSPIQRRLVPPKESARTSSIARSRIRAKCHEWGGPARVRGCGSSRPGLRTNPRDEVDQVPGATMAAPLELTFDSCSATARRGSPCPRRARGPQRRRQGCVGLRAARSPRQWRIAPIGGLVSAVARPGGERSEPDDQVDRGDSSWAESRRFGAPRGTGTGAVRRTARPTAREPRRGPFLLIRVDRRQPDGAHWPTGHRQAYEAA
jgi:hypothetical protein